MHANCVDGVCISNDLGVGRERGRGELEGVVTLAEAYGHNPLFSFPPSYEILSIHSLLSLEP